MSNILQSNTKNHLPQLELSKNDSGNCFFHSLFISYMIFFGASQMMSFSICETDEFSAKKIGMNIEQ